MTDQLGLDDNERLKMGRSASGPVECLGLTFDSEDARREYFSAALAEKLNDPAFRNQPGFPTGTDEDILKMSDPPYYTACPNPFLGEFIRAYGKLHDPGTPYHRDPFAVDVSVGKTDALYKAHSYHTKVPHLAIVPSILHYTEPGDIVLDGFCGSGMTGVAAQFCAGESAEYRLKVEGEFSAQGLEVPKWGARRAVLGDLSPAATFIARGYNIPFDAHEFEREARRILDEVDEEIGWMYETVHSDGRARGRINYTVWSEIFACPECSGEIEFVAAAMDVETKVMASELSCPRCGAVAGKRDLENIWVSVPDRLLGGVYVDKKRRPAIVNYTVAGKVYEKRPDQHDLDVLARIDGLAFPTLPTDAMMHVEDDRRSWGDEWRSGTAAFRRMHHLFLPRQAHAVAAIWSRVGELNDRIRGPVAFLFEQAIPGLSLLNRYKPRGYSQANQYLSGRIRVLSTVAECNPRYVLGGKTDRLAKAFKGSPAERNNVCIETTSCSRLSAAPESVDYVFTDPPFGSNLAYSELNFLIESFHGTFTSQPSEAVVSESQRKGVHEYQELMRSCFIEYERVLKPGRWMTVVFSNSSNAVWRAIQEAIASAGFVIADVRTLDKQQGSFNQVQGVSVTQDLIVSAYKPSSALAKRVVGQAGIEAVWAFLDEHLSNVPVAVQAESELRITAERTLQMLHDRMVGFFVQRGLAIPLSTSEFVSGLVQRYPERDGMYFLPHQVAEYDKRRARAGSVQQLSLMVTDESSAIQWVRQQLESRPQPFPELAPVFMREAQQSWAKHEAQIELKELLEENFLLYDGRGPVPSQIKAYLSTNWRDYRNLPADDAGLQAKARDRWYVPDPGKEADLHKLRERQLIKEFEHYRTSSARKLKLFRTEAVRAGFKRAYDERDWDTIVAVAERLPDSVVQEDEKLLMYYDVARMRIG